MNELEQELFFNQLKNTKSEYYLMSSEEFTKCMMNPYRIAEVFFSKNQLESQLTFDFGPT